MPALRDRVAARLRPLRRAVLRRRRPLAALLVAVATGAGVHAAQAPPPPTVPVTVAARDLPSGTRLTAADLRTARFAPGSEPDAPAGSPVGRTLAAPLRAGEPVTDLRLVGEDLAAGYPGRVALPVRLPDAGMVELLTVGDRIDLLAADPQAGGAEVVATGVPVLAVAPEDDAAGAPDGLSGRLVVIGAPEHDVAEIADVSVRMFLTFAFSG